MTERIVIVEALLRADKDGCDVLNLSLAAPIGWSTGPAGVLASRIAAGGKVVAVSAGNDGNFGSWVCPVFLLMRS